VGDDGVSVPRPKLVNDSPDGSGTRNGRAVREAYEAARARHVAEVKAAMSAQREQVLARLKMRP
jgi:hypothetical protein